MRWFAFHHQKLMKQLKVHTWSAVKELLPTFAPKKKRAKAKASSAEKKVVPVGETVSSLSVATEAFKKLGNGLAKKDQDQLVKTLKTLVTVANDHLGVRLKLVTR